VLEKTGSSVANERSTSRDPLDDGAVRQLLAAATRVIVARGHSRRELAAAETDLVDLKGPTGSYRAPMLLVGTTLVVGFSQPVLAELGLS
jgi:hypothetical protein